MTDKIIEVSVSLAYEQLKIRALTKANNNDWTSYDALKFVNQLEELTHDV